LVLAGLAGAVVSLRGQRDDLAGLEVVATAVIRWRPEHDTGRF
jgi:hypothetical protein